MTLGSLLVAGQPKAAGQLEVRSPWDLTLIETIDTAGPDSVELALSEAQSLFSDRGRWLPIHRRIEILERCAELMRDNAEALARGAAAEGGKPLTDSAVEVARAIDGVRLCIETLRGEHGRVIPVAATKAGAGRLAFTQREPIGVVVAVSAFNHPLNLIVHQVAAAVAAGCPVIVKPAADTPLSGLQFVRLLHEAGLPPEWCQALVTDSNQTAEALVTDARVGFFSFIGSARVGWMLRSKLAPGTRCALEHGGAAPLLIAPDADLDLALPAVLKGGFYHAGQVCVSVQRVFAHESIADSFAGRLAEGAGRLVIGDPTEPDTEVGPLIRPAEVERVDAWVGEALATGGTLLAGGSRHSPTSYECTVIADPSPDAKVSCQEIFGPVVCVYSFADLDSAIAAANALPFAFQAAIFTRSMDTALHAYRRLDASAIMVNDHTAFRVDGMPFAGLRQSGLGVGGIPYTMHDMSIEKMMVVRSAGLD